MIEITRERDLSHSYWYKPSAWRVDYSLLIVVAAGMMKMATGDDSPSGRVPERGLDWFLMATELCGGGTSDLGLFLMVSLFIGFFGVGFTRRWASR